MLAVYVALYNGTTLQRTIPLIGIVMTCYDWKSKFADVGLPDGTGKGRKARFGKLEIT